MDTLSHALYGKGFFGYRKYRWFSFLFGALPDLFSFGLYFLYNLLFNSNKLNFGKPSADAIPYWVYDLYEFSHSIVIAFIFIGIVYKINKDFAFPNVGMALSYYFRFFYT